MEEKTRLKEEAEKKAIEACFRIRKMVGNQNTKIDSEKRRKFINDQLKHYKCVCSAV